MADSVPVSRSKVNENSKTYTLSCNVSKNSEYFNNIVVMSGSAKRRRLETEKNPPVKISQKNNFKESFLKLRAPLCKTHQKHNPPEEKLMTKSCETLLECIKPYKDIHVARRTQVKESTRTIGSILTTDVIYERKATRKVQIFSYSGESRMLRGVHPFNQNHRAVLTENSGDELPEDYKAEHNETGKAISSEDFITDAFSQPESGFIF